MEKTILQVLIAFMITACTYIDIITSFGVVSFVYCCIESIGWLLKRIYLNKEKDPSHPTKIE